MMVPNSHQPHAGNAQVRLNERKIVKTISLKKVSAVAVASLGFGLLSVVPANAADAYTSAATTATHYATVGTAITTTVTIAGDAGSVLTGGTVTATMTAAPSGSTAAASWTSTGIEAPFAAGGTTNNTHPTTYATNVATIAADPDGTGVALTAAKIMGTLSFTPAVAGTYTITLTLNSAFGAGTETNGTITVYAAGLAYALGDGAAVSPATTGNGIAGPANTVTVNATVNASNTRALVSVSGAGATIISNDGTALTAGATSTIVASGGTSKPIIINTPTAGTVTVSQFYESGNGTGIYASTASKTVTITVGTAAVAGGISASSSTAVMNAAATWSSTTEATVTASRTASATPVAAIKVTLAQVAGSITGSTAVTATITGAGTLLLSASDTDPSSSAITGRSVSSTVTTLGEIFTVGVAPDGTSGVGTVTITAGTYTATKTVTFFGSAASYKATNVLNPTANGVATTDAVLVCAADSAGIAVVNSTIYAYSGDTTVATVETSDATEASAIATSGTIPTSHVAKTAVGCVAFDVTGLSQTTKSSVVLTFGNAATQATSTVTTTSTVNVGSVAATTVTLTTNKATYAPGEKMTVTLTFKDSAGRLVGAGPGTGTLAAALTSSASLTGDALFATANASTLGVTEITVYAPLAQGPVVFTGKTGTDATYLATAGRDLAITATATVVDANQSSLLTQIDALNAKIVALNALIAKIMKKLGVK